MPLPAVELTPVLVALLGTPLVGSTVLGVRSVAKRLLLGRRGRAAAEESKRIHQEVELAGQSVLVAGQAQAQLALDNERLRTEIREKDARHAAERQEWMAERAAMRRELDQMEDRLRAALDEVQAMRRRHDGLTADQA